MCVCVCAGANDLQGEGNVWCGKEVGLQRGAVGLGKGHSVHLSKTWRTQAMGAGGWVGSPEVGVGTIPLPGSQPERQQWRAECGSAAGSTKAPPEGWSGI